MENKRYIVSRSDIFVGSVVKTDSVRRYEGKNDFFLTKPGQLSTGSYREYRTMLFVPDHNKFANDLLYNSPNYTALNVSDDAISLATPKDSIIVKDCYNLAELLAYFEYPEELGYQHVLEIKKNFFSGHFAMDNCELFGWKETMPKDCTYYEGGEEVTNPLKLRLIWFRQELARKMGHRSFSGIGGAVLDEKLWEILDSKGNNSLIDVLDGFDERMDMFKPHKEEQHVFKLTR